MSTLVQNRPASAVAAEAKAKRRQQWLERAGKELAAAEAATAEAPPERLAKRLDQMVEVTAKADALEQHDKAEIRDKARAIKLKLYERHIDYLLDETMAVVRDRARQAEKPELLKRVSDAVNAGAKIGLGQDVKDRIKARLGIIRETSAAGESTKAKEDAEREAGRREASYQGERRTFTRWHDPQLVVVIGSRRFSTADWSLAGLLIDEFDAEARKAGEVIDIQVGVAGGPLYKERVEIVRYCEETRQLAVKSCRFASVLMQIKRDCEARQLDPC
jgi:hypothetical protein